MRDAKDTVKVETNEKSVCLLDDKVVLAIIYLERNPIRLDCFLLNIQLARVVGLVELFRGFEGFVSERLQIHHFTKRPSTFHFRPFFSPLFPPF